MKSKTKGKGEKQYLYLTCVECGNKFKAERFRKYCRYQCQRTANARFSKTRYAEMREIVLKAKGVIE